MSPHHPNAQEVSSVRRMHADRFKDFEIDAAVRRALEDDHQWEREKAGRVRTHDWREHVGEAVARHWGGMNFASRVAVALDAETRAAQEEWE